jgi:hypothetical protein
MCDFVRRRNEGNFGGPLQTRHRTKICSAEVALVWQLGSTRHASGRRRGDQFCVYLCDRLVLPTVRDRIDDVAAGRFSLDDRTHQYVRTELGFRRVQVADSREAMRVERLVQGGALAADRPFLNPRLQRKLANTMGE